jgi:hypothetical protein
MISKRKQIAILRKRIDRLKFRIAILETVIRQIKAGEKKR